MSPPRVAVCVPMNWLVTKMHECHARIAMFTLGSPLAWLPNVL